MSESIDASQSMSTNIFSKWMEDDDDDQIDYSTLTSIREAASASHTKDTTGKIPDAAPSDFQNNLTFVQMVNERRQPVSTWMGYKIDFSEKKSEDALIIEKTTFYEKEEDSLRFPRERISVLSSLKNYLYPLFNWHNFGLPAPMRHLLEKPTNIQAFALPYILEGKHAIVRIIDESHQSLGHLEKIRDIVTACTIYEENSWLALENTPIVLNITDGAKISNDLVKKLLRTVQPDFCLEVETILTHSGNTLKMPLPRNLRYIFINDVPAVTPEQINDIAERMPLQCILVILCSSSPGSGLLSGPIAHSLESVTICKG